MNFGTFNNPSGGVKTSGAILYNKCINVTIPSAYDYFYKIGVENLVISIIAMAMTTAMTILYAIEMYYVFKYVSPYGQRAGKLIWMAGVQPLTAIGCLVAVCVPRALGIIEMFILLYFARCLFSVTQLVVDFFGGRVEMAKALQGTTIRLNTPPVCCCCPCLPRAKATAKVIRRIEWFVYQAAIIRPLLYVVTGTINADLAGNVPIESSITTITNVINVISTLLAMYGFLLIANMTDEPLKPYCTKALMKLTQLTIVLYNIQGAIFNVLAQQGVITCSELLPAVSRAAEWHFLLLIAESFLISIGAAYFLRPSVNATFDLYPTHLQNPINPKGWRYIKPNDNTDSPNVISEYYPIQGSEGGNVKEISVKDAEPITEAKDTVLIFHDQNNAKKGTPASMGQSFQNSASVGIAV